jgi:hypothetical protein
MTQTKTKTLPLMTLTMTWQRRGGMTSFNYIVKMDDSDHIDNIDSRIQLSVEDTHIKISDTASHVK